MNKTNYILVAISASLLLVACQDASVTGSEMDEVVGNHYGITASAEILLTAESGEQQASQENVAFRDGEGAGVRIVVQPDNIKQTIDGIGTSFTESSAYVLAHLEPAKRREVMELVFGENGANFTLTRTHIGATDFSVHGKYSYTDVPGDTKLEHFSIAHDRAGFPADKYPGVRDPAYDLLPMIEEAQAIKQGQSDETLRIVSSAWTAPAWMKDIEDWYIPGAPDNNWQGTGGSLKPGYVQAYADYLVKYLDAYAAEGIDIWGITPVNEPHGNNGQWESMHFTPESQQVFVRDHLGPALHAGGHEDVKLLVYDQNRDGLEKWADTFLSDPETSKYVYGIAVHWYESTHKVYEDVLQRVHDRYPDFPIMHTEGTIDDLGKDAPPDIGDPDGYKESGWFDNDTWWWNRNATDWAYTAPWQGVIQEDHPMYTPVHRYARNIIVSLNHWMTGWIDWNIVLDSQGGPNHVGNFCGAPIMIDVETGKIHYTPIFHVLSQFSRTIRPGDRAVQTDTHREDLDADALHAVSTVNAEGLLSVQVLNTTKQPIRYNLQIGRQYAEVDIAANAVQTVRVRLQ